MTSDSNRRRYPRLFLAHKDDEYQSIAGAKLIWPNGFQSQVLDLSYAGLAVSSQGILSQLKIDDVVQVQLRLGENEPFALQVRIVRISAVLIGLKIDTTSVDGRLKIDQHIKDQIVGLSMRQISSDLLHPSAKADVWFHGPFDTNIFLWYNDQKEITKAVIEYDNVFLTSENGHFEMQRSFSATEETKGYAAPYMSITNPKVSLGASWLARLKKLLIQMVDPQDDIKKLIELLKGFENI